MKFRLKDILVVVAFLVSGSLSAAELNLLPNGSFEDYTCNIFGCSFDSWSLPLGTGSANTTDVLDGAVSLQMDAVESSVLDNEVRLPDDYYAPGTIFHVKLQYKVLSLPEDGALALDCYWEPEPGGDAEAMKMHEADRLQGVFTKTVSTTWESLEFSTSKPAKSSKLRIRVAVSKKASVLFDDFLVERAAGAPDEPYIRVTPLRLTPVTTLIGYSVFFPTLHVEQGNVTGTTSFELSGYDADMFTISAHELPADQSEIDLIITYAPTEAGTHTAILNIDNPHHTALFQSITLTGTCIDPTLEPSVKVTPNELPEFKAVEGDEQRDTIQIVSQNCRDYVYLRVEHIKGAAFTVDASLLSKNATTPIQVRFAPTEAGEFESKIVISTEGVQDIVIPLSGIGEKRSESNIDWQTKFEWDESKPLTLMNETFDSIRHNKTLVLEGWQNVAAVDERPWWGFDEAKTAPVRGDGKYAKATTYQYGKPSTDTWEMFLVTPALDYKNAEGKIFTFSVMGEYLPEEEIQTFLEIYYVDATREKAYFQDLTESFGIPFTSDENGIWRTFFLDLAPYAETMADVFHMAFRYIGPNGGAGAVTYYLDDISWGRTDLPQIIVDPTYVIDSSAVVGEKKTLAQIEVTSRNIESEIYMSVGGANYNRFDLSVSSLPARGGTFSIDFEGQEEGVYEAYIVLSSKGAPDAFIPIAVRCGKTTGIESILPTATGSQKVLRDGQLFIERDGKIYTVLGVHVR